MELFKFNSLLVRSAFKENNLTGTLRSAYDTNAGRSPVGEILLRLSKHLI